MKKAILILVCLSGALSNHCFSQNFNLKKLDSLFDVLESKNKVMGNFAVEKNGKIIYTRAIGYSDIIVGEKIKATNNTLYRIGSTTKMFTACIIFQLIDEGKISLTTSLYKYFPTIPNSKLITVATLLNHRSGLYDYVNDQKDLSWVTKPRSKQVIIAEITNGKTKFLPDQKFSYSNSGYYLLACIIETITNNSFNENLQKRICNKIQLENTYSPANNVLKNNEAYSFRFNNNEWNKIAEIYFPNVVGVGDILSTPADLIYFTDALLHGKLISQSCLKLMKTIGNHNFGMGIMSIPFYKKTAYGHGGDTYGSHTVVAKFLDDSLTVALCINGELYAHNDISIGLLSICFNEQYEIPSFKILELDTSMVKNYVGKYANKELGMKITITHANKILYAQATNQPAFPLELTEKHKFIFSEAGIVIEFDSEKNVA